MSDHIIMVIWVIKTFFVQFCVFLSPLLKSLLLLLGPYCFCLYCAYLCMKCLVSLIFLRSLVFPILLFSPISLHRSPKAFLSLLAVLWNSAFRWIYLSFSPLPFTSLLSYLLLFFFLIIFHCIITHLFIDNPWWFSH